MTSSEILLFVKEEVAKHGDGKPSSLVIQAIREACLNLVSSKAAEAPGGQDCDCVIEIDSSRTATVIHQAGCRYSQLYEAFRRACEQVWRCTDAPGQTLESTMQFYLAAPAAPSERADAREQFERENAAYRKRYGALSGTQVSDIEKAGLSLELVESLEERCRNLEEDNEHLKDLLRCDPGQTINDGFGSTWSRTCPTCGLGTMHVNRPGDVQCDYCG